MDGLRCCLYYSNYNSHTDHLLPHYCLLFAFSMFDLVYNQFLHACDSLSFVESKVAPLGDRCTSSSQQHHLVANKLSSLFRSNALSQLLYYFSSLPSYSSRACDCLI